MSESKQIVAELREARGTGGARATRRAGRVPGIIYGGGRDPLAISVEPRQLRIELDRGGFFARLLNLSVNGEKVPAVARDVQFEPVSDAAIHIDFLRVTPSSRITVEVPVRFINQEQSPGLKVGGVLNVVRYTVEVSCRADAIPEAITVDVAGSEIGHSFHISNVTLPDGVRPTITDRNFTIASIAAPTTAIVETPVAAAVPAEGEAAAAAEGEGAEGEAKPEGGEAKGKGKEKD